ncbi:MAG: exodeoxyribonuclease VII small subunit [Actinomycetaceae bacterium]|nr:exodeoxyribonuclease VII small subunit [Arcanobacterium sp.]MDD7687433.1 exodeoxyribonuclease VII small subunit [Actinomycetaceae bacterium]MDY5272907.1 exodeoxyribonuclease VII small subunit [Arcanobacterium sp.]
MNDAVREAQQLSSSRALDAAVAQLSYEEARSQLVAIVAQLEQGNIPLEQSLDLWERGEALARRCESWLAGARERLAAAQTATEAAHTHADQEETEANS